LVDDAAAEGLADKGAPSGGRAAVTALREVAHEGAAGDGDGGIRPDIMDGAAHATGAAGAAEGLVASEGTARDGQGPAIPILGGPASAGLVGGGRKGFIVG